MVIAADYPFLDVFWTLIIFFLWVAWLVILFRVIADVFRRHDASGWVKAGWVVVLIFLPFLGVLVYLIAHGDDMGRRDLEQSRAVRAEFDDYVRSVADSGGPAAEIERAKQLLDGGAISQAEFEAIKARALA